MCYILIPFLIMLTLFAIIGFERSMWLSVDFWNKKEYKLFKIICGVIGGSRFETLSNHQRCSVLGER